MIKETTNYYCDNCNNEMTKHEHEDKAIKIFISVRFPNETGKCGEQTGVTMVLCENCSKEVGLVNDQEIHKYTYAHKSFTEMVKKYKQNILALFKGKL